GDGARHAADGRDGHGDRSPAHGDHGPRHPRDDPLPAREVGAARPHPRVPPSGVQGSLACMPERLPGDPPPKISTNRIIVWVVVAGIGLWLIGTGIAGIIAKGA